MIMGLRNVVRGVKAKIFKTCLVKAVVLDGGKSRSVKNTVSKKVVKFDNGEVFKIDASWGS